ncbi:MAG: CD225/dispanin family protein [Bacteroidales bacterium]
MENQSIQGQPPKTWLVESILVTLFCCLPFGIIGIINASKVESKFMAGAVDEAIQASKDAGKWTKIGFFTGIGVYVVGAIFYAIFFAAMIGSMGAY